MNNHFWLLIQTKDENGLFYPYLRRVSTSDNIKAILGGIPDLMAANIAPTKKAAEAWVDTLRATHRAQGNLKFEQPDDPF